MEFISVSEYLMNRGTLEELPDDIVRNINTLIPKINELLERFGEKRSVTSGLRRMEDHLRIYKEINAKRKAKGLPEQKVPMGSAHLSGEAIDLIDKDSKLKDWIKNNIKVLEELELYCEAFEATPNWVHIQIRKPKLGNRFFKP